MIIFFYCFLLLPVVPLIAQEPGLDLMGEWELVTSGDGFQDGRIIFLDGAEYQFFRTWPDGTGAEISGGYELDTDSSPAHLRLCLDDCSAAGSEWTSSFCVIRLNSPEEMEIYISQSGAYPGGFPEDPGEQGAYLFRKVI